MQRNLRLVYARRLVSRCAGLGHQGRLVPRCQIPVSPLLHTLSNTNTNTNTYTRGPWPNLRRSPSCTIDPRSNHMQSVSSMSADSTYVEQSVIPSSLFAPPSLPQLPAAVPHLENLALIRWALPRSSFGRPSTKTLPEAQRTYNLESITWVISPAK